MVNQSLKCRELKRHPTTQLDLALEEPGVAKKEMGAEECS